jgi:hypothetical protein
MINNQYFEQINALFWKAVDQYRCQISKNILTLIFGVASLTEKTLLLLGCVQSFIWDKNAE